METHDSAIVDNATGVVVGGEALDDGYNQGILPPLNPCPQGRSRKRRIESQRSGSAQNAERLDTTEARAGICAQISMHMRQLLSCPWRIYLKGTTSRMHNMKVYDIDPTPASAFIPQLRAKVTSVVNTVCYGGWTDDTYLFTLPPGREAAKLTIRLTTLNELNGVVYEVSNARTAHHCGFTSAVPPVTCKKNHSSYAIVVQWRRIHANVGWMRTYSKVTVHIGDSMPAVRKGTKSPVTTFEVINDLLHESTLERDWVLEDRSARLWSREEDMRMDAERRAEVDMLWKLLGVVVATIAILLAFCIHAELVIYCDCDWPADIISIQGDKYQRHLRKCKHFQWVDDRLTRADKISVRNLQAENRSLRADLLTATATLRRYMDAEIGVELLINDGIRGQLMSLCVCVTAVVAYVMIFRAVLI
ncbi:hypothetical protein Cgig2_032346 [Carnegiea gigantea]|uniref:Uncharacterized protein n=1 Tax=Carnegiea gigantea TaxID=171969 RepID=A0A9Q1GYT5_9CARY|nr:hypothetical protein Cgig2_032346 [Carnegiea gigantea]